MASSNPATAATPPPADAQRAQPRYARELLILAMPMVGMTVTRFLMNFIDFTMVSALGTTHQAAISPASLFTFAVGCVGMGIAHGVQTFASQADGRGERRIAGSYAWQSLYIAALFTLISVPVALTARHWFAWIAALGQHTEQVAALEVAYIEIALFALGPTVACVGLNGLFNGVQKPVVALWATIFSLAVNALGNYVLIFGALGFPELGIAGAAVATVIGWLARAAFMLVVMLSPRFDAEYHTRRTWRINASRMGNLVRIGAPTSVQWLIDLGSWLVFIVLIIPPFGEIAMAASNIGVQYMHLGFMPAIGIGMAVSSKVGFAIGEGRKQNARRWAAAGFRIIATYMGAAALLMVLLPRQLIWIFNDSPEVILVGITVMIWVAVFQVFDAMAITFSNALRGAGDTRVPAVIVALCSWVVFIGGGLVVRTYFPQFGISGPWSTCAAYLIALGSLLLLRWKSGAWERIDLSEKADPATVASPADSALKAPGPDTGSGAGPGPEAPGGDLPPGVNAALSCEATRSPERD